MAQSLSQLNSLSVEVYGSGTTLLNDPDNDARRLVVDGYRKQYPGGVFVDGSLYAYRKIARSWLVHGAQRRRRF